MITNLTKVSKVNIAFEKLKFAQFLICRFVFKNVKSVFKGICYTFEYLIDKIERYDKYFIAKLYINEFNVTKYLLIFSQLTFNLKKNSYSNLLLKYKNNYVQQYKNCAIE